jgi:hypothetical protein
MTKNFAIIILGLCLCGITAKAEISAMSKFIGVWYVDVDRTQEEVKNDPRSAKTDPQTIKKMVELMATMTTLEVTDKSLSYVTDMKAMYPNAKADTLPKAPVMQYTVAQTSNNSTTLKCSKGNNPIEIVLSLIDEKHIRAKSAESPEYNHIVWQKDKYVPPLTKGENDNIGIAGKDVIAVVLGKPIGLNAKSQMKNMIFRALLDKYAKDNNIEPTEPEIDALVEKTEELKRQREIDMEKEKQELLVALKDNTISEIERKKKEAMLETIEKTSKMNGEIKERLKGMEEQTKFAQRQVAQGFVKSWKINKALYEKYGGRVIFQQAGAEPLDAYRDFLQEQEKNGAFKIMDKTDESEFWKYFTNDAMHKFYSKDEGAKFINTPWWMMKNPAK